MKPVQGSSIKEAIHSGSEHAETRAAKTKKSGIDRRACIAASLNITTGTRLHGKELSNQRVTEEQLILAGTFDRLSKVGKNVARRFIHEVGDTWQKMKTSGEKFSIFKSIDSEMTELVSEGKLTKTHAEKILRYALGKGNLDKDVTNLDLHKRLTTAGVPAKTAETYIERILSVTSRNRSATQTELDEVRKKASAARPGTPDAPSSTTTPSASDVKEAVPAPLPESGEVESRHNEMAYYPSWAGTGKAVFIIPDGYADEVDRVSVHDAGGALVEELNGRWKSEDGRRHFRSNKTGAEFGNGITFVLHFTDGSTVTKNLESGSAFRRWSYTF